MTHEDVQKLDSNPRLHQGRCHCGAVHFEVTIDLETAGISRCNCSICTKVASVGGVVKPAAFKLLAGADALSTYQWGSKVGTRFFCRHCGVHCYGDGNVPELGGEFVSVNVNCLEGIDHAALRLVHWDGRHDNWQAGPRMTPWSSL